MWRGPLAYGQATAERMRDTSVILSTRRYTTDGGADMGNTHHPLFFHGARDIARVSFVSATLRVRPAVHSQCERKSNDHRSTTPRRAGGRSAEPLRGNSGR